MTEMFDQLDEVLDTFQWAYPDRGNNRGEIHVDREACRLVLVVWTQDNEDPDNEATQPLNVSVDVDPSEDPRDQIRELIHSYLTHEADEQMWFDQERIFFPHDENGKTRNVSSYA
jgi:hypothetical protein